MRSFWLIAYDTEPTLGTTPLEIVHFGQRSPQAEGVGTSRLAFGTIDQLGRPRTSARVWLGAYGAHGKDRELVGCFTSLWRVGRRRYHFAGALFDRRLSDIDGVFHFFDAIASSDLIRNCVSLRNAGKNSVEFREF